MFEFSNSKERTHLDAALGNSEERVNRIYMRRTSNRALLTPRCAKSFPVQPALLVGREGDVFVIFGEFDPGSG